jgi:hypothetical protein
MQNKTKSGFFDLEPEIKTCTSPAHDLPKHIVIPQGKGYQHVCPECGLIQIITPTQVRLSDSH